MTDVLEKPQQQCARHERRCDDCDEDCWHVRDKRNCWLHDPDKGLCPFLYPGLPLPPTN